MELRGLCKSYGALKVLDHFSLSLPDKGVFCISGNSGCGKTTLLHILAGLISPEGGEIKGLEQKKITYLFQEDRLLPWLSVEKNISVVRPGVGEPEILRLLETVELSACRNAHLDELSGGMRRRVAIARALLHDGDIFLMDEPFKGLDEDLTRRILERMRDYFHSKLVVIVSHNPEECRAIVAERIVFEGPPLRVMHT